ncbi:MAG: NAD(P)H-dependent glycerol-3-phosphate dehydrogenase [Gammaproteobacteria bacterium]
MHKISVIGAGSWGTALAILLARQGHQVFLWGHDPEHLKAMMATRRNDRYLPDSVLPDGVAITLQLATALATSEIALVVVPSHAFREQLMQIKQCKTYPSAFIWASKGVDPQTGQLLHLTMQEVLPHVKQFAVLSGPSFAREVAAGLPTAITLAANDEAFAQLCCRLFHSDYFRVYCSDDFIGVELGGIVKNIFAIAAGISDGLNFGANARCALITRGLAEMMRLGQALGAQPHTLMGLAGLGDLVLTCTDDQSRNRRFGLAIARNADIQQAQQAIGQVVEGFRNTAQIYHIAQKYQVEMPITEQVYKVLQGQITPRQAVTNLLSRSASSEF